MRKLFEYFGYDKNLRREDKFAYIIAAFGWTQLLAFLPFYGFVAKEGILVFETILIFLAYSSIFYFFKKKEFLLGKNIIVAGFMIQVLLLVFIWFPKEANFRYYYFIVAPISFFIFDFSIKKERFYIILLNILAAVQLILSDLIQPMELLVLESEYIKLFSVMALSFTIISEIIVFYFYALNLSDTQKSLKRLAETDALTNIANRRVLFNEGDLYFKICKDTESHFTLILMDIDFFKNVNDQYGHPAGDQVLKLLTERILKNIRKRDLVCRYGGEEFAVLFKALPPEYEQVIRQLKDNIEKEPFAVDNHKIELTLSIGAVNCSKDFKNFDELVAVADKMLYQAKETGRDRIAFYDNK